MIEPGDRIVAGVSGGADSVCLLYLLWEYSGKIPLTLAVVHVNHGIREEAGRDARFVELLCHTLGVPFFLSVADVHGRALKEKRSEEDVGRQVRYEAFRREAERLGHAHIAVAHNSNDNAETMLFHLFRGSGIRGLCGIAPVRKEGERKVIRPILCLERWEVEEYLRQRGVSWCMDDTNNGDDYRRNRIRHHILPYAAQEIAGGVVEHMCRTGEMLRETEDYLEQQTKLALEQCLLDHVGEEIEIYAGSAEIKRYNVSSEMFGKFHPALQNRMVLLLLERLSPTGKDISRVHVRSVMDLLLREGNRSADLPCGITVWRQYGKVIMEHREEDGDSRCLMGKTEEKNREVGAEFGSPGQFETMCRCGKDLGDMSRVPEDSGSGNRILENPGREAWDGLSVQVPDRGKMEDVPFVCRLGIMGDMEFTLFESQMEQEFPKNRYTKWFDYDKIEEPLIIRTRCVGDFLTIADGEGYMIHKSLKDYMVTEKIPRQLRDRLPVVASGRHILWLPGWRISEYYKVDGRTRYILQIKLFGRSGEGATEEKDVRTH